MNENAFKDIGISKIPISNLISVVLSSSGRRVTKNLSVKVYFNRTQVSSMELNAFFDFCIHFFSLRI